MTGARFDELIHAPLRLRICATLAPLEQADFAVVREALGVSDSVLSKHAATLEAAGYLLIGKTPTRGRVRTTLALSRAGRRAYAGHVAALRAIVADAGADLGAGHDADTHTGAEAGAATEAATEGARETESDRG